MGCCGALTAPAVVAVLHERAKAFCRTATSTLQEIVAGGGAYGVRERRLIPGEVAGANLDQGDSPTPTLNDNYSVLAGRVMRDRARAELRDVRR